MQKTRQDLVAGRKRPPVPVSGDLSPPAPGNLQIPPRVDSPGGASKPRRLGSPYAWRPERADQRREGGDVAVKEGTATVKLHFTKKKKKKVLGLTSSACLALAKKTLPLNLGVETVKSVKHPLCFSREYLRVPEASQRLLVEMVSRLP